MENKQLLKNKDIKFCDLNNMIIYGYDREFNRFVYIDNCKNGLACNLVCRFCGNPLNAKNNCVQKCNHFAHKSGSDCKKGHEETIPLMANQILEESKSIYLPSEFGIDGRFYTINKIELEEIKYDLSFNVIFEIEDGRTICLVACVESNDIYRRKSEARQKYNYVLFMDLFNFRGSDFVVKDLIKACLLTESVGMKWLKHLEIDKERETRIQKQSELRQKKYLETLSKQQIVQKQIIPYGDTLVHLSQKNDGHRLIVVRTDTETYYEVSKRIENGEIIFTGRLFGKSTSSSRIFDDLTPDATKPIWIKYE